jgi:hypothetical protein
MSLCLPRFRKISIDDLTPHPDVVESYVLWLSVHRDPKVAFVEVVKDGKNYVWFGGFSGLQSITTGRIDVRIHRKLPSTFDADAWREAARAEGVRDYGNWFRKLEHLLPEKQKINIFGPRGLTKSSAALFAGVTRQTLHSALRRMP